MKDRDAHYEARRRWEKAAITVDRGLQASRKLIDPGLPRYAVGRATETMWEILGEGETWEEAFAAVNIG